MLNKTIRIYCDEKDKDTVTKAIGSYTDYDGFMINEHMGVVRLLFNCNMFKVNKLKHDVELLNNIGVSAEIR